MPKTLQEQYAAGLTALDYEKLPTRNRHRMIFHKPGSGKNWYLGKAGSVRTGANVTESRPVSTITKDYLRTAPALRPKVFAALAEMAPSPGFDPKALARDLARKPELVKAGRTEDEAFRILLLHVISWAKEKATS